MQQKARKPFVAPEVREERPLTELTLGRPIGCELVSGHFVGDCYL